MASFKYNHETKKENVKHNPLLQKKPIDTDFLSNSLSSPGKAILKMPTVAKKLEERKDSEFDIVPLLGLYGRNSLAFYNNIFQTKEFSDFTRKTVKKLDEEYSKHLNWIYEDISGRNPNCMYRNPYLTSLVRNLAVYMVNWDEIDHDLFSITRQINDSFCPMPMILSHEEYHELFSKKSLSSKSPEMKNFLDGAKDISTFSEKTMPQARKAFHLALFVWAAIKLSNRGAKLGEISVDVLKTMEVSTPEDKVLLSVLFSEYFYRMITEPCLYYRDSGSLELVYTKEISKVKSELGKEKNKNEVLKNKLFKAEKKVENLEKKKDTGSKQIVYTDKGKSEELSRKLKDKEKELEALQSEYEKLQLKYLLLLEDGMDEESKEEPIPFDFNKRYAFAANRLDGERGKSLKPLLSYFPNAKIISKASTGMLQNVDMVISLSHYIEDHSFYYAIKSAAENAGVPLMHCNKSNSEKIIDAMKALSEGKARYTDI